MNGKKLWIQFWTEKDKQRKKNNCIKGLQFLQSYTPQGHSVLLELLAGLEMTLGGRWNSGYKVIMPSNERGYRRVRLANHPFELSEWPIHEEDGLPNERYSIFIYNEKTCPQFANVPETDWRSEYSEGVPIYEKGFNERYLKRLLPKLLRILALIYQGGAPQPDKLPLKIEESKTNKNVIKLNENTLRQIVAEIVKKVMNEDYVYQMGRGEVSIDAAYQRIDKTLDALKHIADTMSDNGYYETEESALRSQINYIELLLMR